MKGHIKIRVWRVIIFIILILSSVFVVLHTRNIHRRLNRIHVRPSTRWKFKDNALVTFQHNRQQMLGEWFRLTSEAKHEIVFSTYHWFTYRQRCKTQSHGEITPHILSLGLGMLESQKQRIMNGSDAADTACPPVRCIFLLNRDPHVSRGWAKKQFQQCCDVWRSLGVHVDDDKLWRMEFYIWHQLITDNMHVKILAVDGQVVNITSGNIQYGVETDRPRDAPERLIPHCEGENAVTVSQHPKLVRQCVCFVKRLCSYRRSECFVPAGLCPRRVRYFTPDTLVRWCGPTLNRLPLRDVVRQCQDWTSGASKNPNHAAETSLCLSEPVVSMWNSSWPSTLDPLLTSIREAKTSITCLVPNFSDQTIWRELCAAMERGVSVEVVTGKYFNDKGAIIKYASALRSNMEMFCKHILPYWRCMTRPELLRWHWYGYEGRAVESKAPRCAHHKLWMIDHNTVITGSLNAHVFAVYNVAEIMVCIKSDEAFKEVWDQCVQSRLHNAQEQSNEI